MTKTYTNDNVRLRRVRYENLKKMAADRKATESARDEAVASSNGAKAQADAAHKVVKTVAMERASAKAEMASRLKAAKMEHDTLNADVQTLKAAVKIETRKRKASAKEPWKGGLPLDKEDEKKGIYAWKTVAPSSIALAEGWQVPKALEKKEIDDLILSYVKSAKLAIEAGFKVLEIHAAHGYLLHSFLSPISNKRNDEYGGTLEGRAKILKDITISIRNNISDKVPLFCRISAIDGQKNGWELNDSISLSKILAKVGIDVIDCSSGGIAGRPRFAANDDGSVLKSNFDRGLGFQVPYAHEIKKNSSIKTMAVGVIVDPKQAENILIEEQADLIAMGRELMYNPFWSLHAAQILGVDPDYSLWPKQYRWGVNRRSKIEKFNNVK